MSHADMDTGEMMKMFETAKRMSDMLNMRDDSGENAGAADYAKIAELAGMLNSFRSSPAESTDNTGCQDNGEKGGTINYIDIESRVQTPEVLTIKAAIPFLEPRYQKNISVFVKLIEIRRLMELYRDVAVSAQSRDTQGGEWRCDMLTAVRPYMEEKKRHMIDMLIKCIELSGIMQKIKEE